MTESGGESVPAWRRCAGCGAKPPDMFVATDEAGQPHPARCKRCYDAFVMERLNKEAAEWFEAEGGRRANDGPPGPRIET